jgi:hypothetical protein
MREALCRFARDDTDIPHHRRNQGRGRIRGNGGMGTAWLVDRSSSSAAFLRVCDPAISLFRCSPVENPGSGIHSEIGRDSGRANQPQDVRFSPLFEFRLQNVRFHKMLPIIFHHRIAQYPTQAKVVVSDTSILKHYMHHHQA